MRGTWTPHTWTWTPPPTSFTKQSHRPPHSFTKQSHRPPPPRIHQTKAQTPPPPSATDPTPCPLPARWQRIGLRRLGGARSRVVQLAGAIMLIFGAVNLTYGSVVALKLKKMRRSLASAAALRAAYRAATGGPPGAAADGAAATGLADGATANSAAASIAAANSAAGGADGAARGTGATRGVDLGLDQAAAATFFSELGTVFSSKMQVQCAFLEIDAARCGRITERALMHWYHGHIGRELKRCANAPRRRSPARGQLHRRDSNGALVQWAQTALFDMGVYASAVCVLLITASIAATILALAHRSVLQVMMDRRSNLGPSAQSARRPPLLRPLAMALSGPHFARVARSLWRGALRVASSSGALVRRAAGHQSLPEPRGSPSPRVGA